MSEILIVHLILALIATHLIWWGAQRQDRTICEKTKWNKKSHNKIHDGENDDL